MVPTVNGLADLERLEDVGMLGVDMPRTFNTCAWFDTVGPQVMQVVYLVVIEVIRDI